MATFVQLQRMNSDHDTTNSIIFNMEDILMVSFAVALNTRTGQQETFTRVILQGYPEISFDTKVSMLAFEGITKTVDITGGPGVGSSCTVDGVLDIVKPQTSYPFVKFLRINNNVSVYDDPYLANLNYLFLVESNVYINQQSGIQQDSTFLTFRGQPLRKIHTDSTFSVIQSLLEPTVLS